MPRRKFRDPEDGNKHRSGTAEVKQKKGADPGDVVDGDAVVVDAAALEDDMGEDDASVDEQGDVPAVEGDVAASTTASVPVAALTDDAHVTTTSST